MSKARRWVSGAAPALARGLALLLALGALLAAQTLAWHHPLWPHGAALACLGWSAAMARWPRLCLFAIPLGASFLNAAPWSGWIVCDEFDLLLLSSLGGGYARRALLARPATLALPPALRTLAAVMATAALLGLCRALADAAATPAALAAGWYAGYGDALNSLRVAKSELYALLLLPLLPQAAGQDSAGAIPPAPAKPTPDAQEPLAWGMVAGLCVVVLAVLWERLAFPGLLDFSTPYRTVALFWEMHVGGEAIDAYLALAAPFAAWAVLAVRRPKQWTVAALLALLTGYALLTTFSRGVYAASVAGLLLGLLRLRQGPPLQGWRARAGQVLVLLLLAEAALVLGSGSFMRQRLADSDSDLHSRLHHWQRGLGTLHGTGAWLLGLGPGRLPAHYAAQGPAGEFSGAATWAAGPPSATAPQAFVTLHGPATRSRLAGQFALAQRVPAPPAGPQVVRLQLRVQAVTDLQLEWCERHLLYDGRCLSAQVRVLPQDGAWQTRELPLTEQVTAGTVLFAQAKPQAPRLALFSLSLLSAGAAADVSDVLLPGPNGANLLHNADFGQGLAHWLGMAQSYFLPWHIDNLWLELLVERGLLGLALFCTLLGAALWHLTCGRARRAALAPYLAAALTGTLCVGMTGSLLDVPRVALLLYLLAWQALQLSGRTRANLLVHAKNQRPQNAAEQTAVCAVNGTSTHGQNLPPLHP